VTAKRNNPATTIELSGPQLREFLRLQGNPGEILDKRIGRALRDKGLVTGTLHQTWISPGYSKHHINWGTTVLGDRVSRAVWQKSASLPSIYDGNVDWSKEGVTIVLD
jgi:hypothetical protein